jgi:hypothetical protein
MTDNIKPASHRYIPVGRNNQYRYRSSPSISDLIVPKYEINWNESREYVSDSILDLTTAPRRIYFTDLEKDREAEEKAHEELYRRDQTDQYERCRTTKVPRKGKHNNTTGFVFFQLGFAEAASECDKLCLKSVEMRIRLLFPGRWWRKMSFVRM